MEQQILDDVPSTEQNDVTWAGFWIRVGASLVDVLVYLPFVGLNFYNTYTLKNLPLQIFIILLFILYKPFMEYRYGGTLGKMAVKIKVVNLNFGKISLGQSVIRNYPQWLNQLVSLILAILMFNRQDFQSADTITAVGLIQNTLIPPYVTLSISMITIVSVIVVAFTEKKQGLHDMIAGTCCVYR